MKTKYKKKKIKYFFHSMDKIFENKNLLNNQNYILSKNKKKKIVRAAYNKIVNKKNSPTVYSIKKVFSRKNYDKKLNKWNIWYINNQDIKWFNMELYMYLFLWFFSIILLLWINSSYDYKSIKTEIWIYILVLPIHFISAWIHYFKNKNLVKKFIIIKNKIKSDKFYLKKYKK